MPKERILLERQLYGALGRLEISIAYQPQVDAYHASDRGGSGGPGPLAPPCPGQCPPVIPLAEEIGVIAPIGRFILRNPLRHAQEWRREGLEEVTLSVNISARQLNDHSLVDDAIRFLEESDTPPHLLKLEVAETAAMADSEFAAEILGDLARLGVTISLDDFGTGYSNLGKLHHLAISTIKIDRSFVSSPPRRPPNPTRW